MLQATSERPAAGAGMWVPGMSPQPAAAGMWVPGMSPQPADAGAARLWVPGMTPTPQAAESGALGSARAREIAQRREEMLGMLHGLPEAEYELSLTDLVEKTGGVAPTKEAAPSASLPLGPPPTESTKEATPSPSPLGPAAEQQPAPAPRTERKGSARRRGDGGRSFRSSSDGVLLNFYMTRSLTRSFTAPRPARAQPAVRPAASVVVVSDDRNKRERDGDTVKCWPLPWDRRWRKSSRRDLTAQPVESAAIIEAAKHSAPPAKT